MNFEEYKLKAITTIVFKDEIKIPYTICGMNGENGELNEAVLRFLKTDKEDLAHNYSLFLKELGDVSWYIAALSSFTGINIDESLINIPIIYDENFVNQIHQSQKTIDFNQVLFEDMLNLTTNIGAVAEAFKKRMRDDWDNYNNDIYSDEFKEKISFLFSQSFRYMLNILKDVNIIKDVFVNEDIVVHSLSDIWQMNIDKLSKRKDEGKLHGSGDER